MGFNDWKPEAPKNSLCETELDLGNFGTECFMPKNPLNILLKYV